MPANVLIVDDSPTMRRVIRKMLLISGLDVGELYEASNGIEALAQLDQYEVAVMLVDINMPIMGGVQLITRIRDDERLRNIPIVIASTEGSETRIRELLAGGARGYVRKPFHPEQLRDALAPIIGLGQGAPAAVSDESAF